MQRAEWIAVDWGTSSVRLWGIAPGGQVAFAESADEGMAKLTPDAYGAVLNRLLNGRLETGHNPVDVMICGMAGARQGWLEAPYIDVPASLGSLAGGAVSPEAGPDLRVSILPGICQRTEGAEDVMRGEETQLLGLLSQRPDFRGTVVLPGTHTKWVSVEDGRVTRFATAMTGELYDVIGNHSVLRHAMAGEQLGPETEAGVAAGLASGLAHPDRLTSLLFRTRAASLLSGHGADWSAGYLSGLLVGAEVGGHRDWFDDASIPLIGSARLCRLYAAALTRAGVRAEILDATEITLAGLSAARQQDAA